MREKGDGGILACVIGRGGFGENLSDWGFQRVFK